MDKHIEQQEQVTDSQKIFNWINGKVSATNLKGLEEEHKAVLGAVSRKRKEEDMTYIQWDDMVKEINDCFFPNLRMVSEM